MSDDPAMSLDKALFILADTHTRDDDLAGFVVMAGARPEFRFSQSDYIQAWGTVRRHLHMPVDPKQEE
jgi:hypothetical protein